MSAVGCEIVVLGFCLANFSFAHADVRQTVALEANVEYAGYYKVRVWRSDAFTPPDFGALSKYCDAKGCIWYHAFCEGPASCTFHVAVSHPENYRNITVTAKDATVFAKATAELGVAWNRPLENAIPLSALRERSQSPTAPMCDREKACVAR